MFLDVLWPAYNVPKLLLKTPLPDEFILAAFVTLLFAYMPYYLWVPATIPADIKFSTCNFETPSVFPTPSANPNNFLLPKLNVPFTDTAPLLVVMIALVD